MDALGRGRWLVLTAALMWSLGGILAKEIPLAGGPLAAYRSLIAGLMLLPLVPRGRRVLAPGLIPLAAIFGAMIGFYLGSLKLTTAANAIYLQFSAIFWTIPLSAVWLREKADPRSVAGIAVALVGIILILAWGRDGRPGEGTGIGLGLASGVAYAAVVVGLRRFRAFDPTWLAAFVNLAGAGFLAVWLVATSGPGAIPIPATSLWPLLLTFGVVQMGIPYVLFSRGLQTVRAPEAALIGLLEPVLSPIWVWLRHDEQPAPATLVGGLFLLAGVGVRYVPRWEVKGRIRPADSGPRTLRDDRVQYAEDDAQIANIEAFHVEKDVIPVQLHELPVFPRGKTPEDRSGESGTFIE